MVDGIQLLRRVQVTLIQSQNKLHPLLCGDGRHPVNQEGLRHRVHLGRQHHKGVHIGHRRTDKTVFPGKKLLHIAVAAAHSESHPISHQGRNMLPAEFSPGTTPNHPLPGVHVIEAAEGTDNDTLRLPAVYRLTHRG